MAPERAAPRKRGFGGALAHKLGPFPVWVWALIVTAIILGYVWFKASRSQDTGTQSPGPGEGQVPQFVNQTFVSPGPPGPPDEDDDDDDDDFPRSHPIPGPGPRPPHPKPPHPRPPRPGPRPPGGGGQPPPGHG